MERVNIKVNGGINITFWLIPLIFSLGYICILANIGEFYRHNFGVWNPEKDYLLGLIWASIITVLLLVIPLKYKKYFILLWFIKIFIIFVFDLFYEYKYDTLDAYSYYYVASINPHYDFKVFLATYNTESLTGFINYLTGSYRATLVVYSLIGFWATYIFLLSYRILKNIHISKKEIFLFLFFPSFIFWSHILGKDPIVLLLIAVYTYGLVNLINGRVKFVYIFCILIAFILLLFFRFWLIGILGISIVLSSIFFKISKSVKIILFFVLLVFSAAGINVTFHYFGIHDINSLIYKIGELSKSWARGGSAQVIEINSLKDYLLNLPWLSFTALFRPLPYEAKNIFQLLSGIENIILLTFVLLGTIRMLKNKYFKDNRLKILAIHIIVWTAVYAPISYQNLGTASRFKLQILPFLLMFILLVFSYKTLKVRE